MRKRLLLVTIGWALVAIAVLACWQWSGLSAPSQRLRNRLGDDTIDIIQSANRVEAFRVDKNPEKAEGRPAEQVIGGFLITARGPERGQDFARKLSAVVLKDDTHFHNEAIACFFPGIAFRLWKGEKSVDVVICFYCRNLQVALSDKPPLDRDFGNSTNAMRAALVQLAKEAFPDDAEIQGLKRPYGCGDQE